MPTRSQVMRALIVLLIFQYALWVRDEAASTLVVDQDEPTYVQAAYRYREMIEGRRWHDLQNFSENYEHPPLVKVLCGLSLAASGASEPNWKRLKRHEPVPAFARPAFDSARRLSVIGAGFQALILACVNPPAGLLLADHGYHVKYTSQVYLEAVPGLFAILAVTLFECGARRSRREPGKRSAAGMLLVVLSAISLGVATAGKYPYGIMVGPVIVAFLFARTRRIDTVAIYLLIAACVLFAADPVLWPDPFGRLWRSLTFHWQYGQQQQITLPWWRPLSHFTHVGEGFTHYRVPKTGLTDILLFPLAILGLPWAIRRRPVWAAWAGWGLVFLLLWPTKWPQYILLDLPPLAVCAGVGLQEIAGIWMRAWKAAPESPSTVTARPTELAPSSSPEPVRVAGQA